MSRHKRANSQGSAVDTQKLSNQIQQLQALSQNALQKKLNEQRYSFEYLGIPSISRHDIIDIFGGITFIAIMGPASRAEHVAKKCVSVLKVDDQYRKIGDSEFFSVFKVGTILSCSHGMGLSSVCLFLNELFRIMNISKNNDFELVRLGSSGGVGVEGGTLVVSTHALDPVSMKPEWEYFSCGHPVKQECMFSQQIYKRLHAISKAKKFAVEFGKTVSAETYYEAQARLDGALCEYSEKEKMNYLQTLYKNGVRNFEMEGTVVAGICTKNNVKCGMLAVSYLNRLKEDTVSKKYTAKDTKQWMENAIDVLLDYIHRFALKK